MEQRACACTRQPPPQSPAHRKKAGGLLFPHTNFPLFSPIQFSHQIPSLPHAYAPSLPAHRCTTVSTSPTHCTLPHPQVTLATSPASTHNHAIGQIPLACIVAARFFVDWHISRTVLASHESGCLQPSLHPFTTNALTPQGPDPYSTLLRSPLTCAFRSTASNTSTTTLDFVRNPPRYASYPPPASQELRSFAARWWRAQLSLRQQHLMRLQSPAAH